MITDTARMLDDTTGRLLARHFDDPFADRAALREEVLAEAVEAGLPLALVPEDEGGLGGILSEAAVIARRAGWHAAPLPIPALLLVPLLGGAEWDSASMTLSADTLVPDGDNFAATAIVAPATGTSETVLALCADAGQTQVVAFATEEADRFHALDGTPWLRLDPNRTSINGKWGSPLPAQAVQAQGALLTAAAMGGAMARVQDIVIEHANTRKQFGRPLGKFQAIQHRIAEAVGEATVAEAALSGAMAAFDAGDTRPIHWRAAKAQAGRAATILAGAAHQILGAIGFTDEHALHHYTRRLWVWRDDWGRQAEMERAIGEAAAADPRGLWPHLVDDAA